MFYPQYLLGRRNANDGATTSNHSGTWVYNVEVEKKYTVKFEPKQYMSPIPQNVIDQNPKISQNPGY